MQDEMLIFMEYCAEGTIEEVAKQGLSEIMVRRYTNELLMAISVLHDNGIIHRDIKGQWPLQLHAIVILYSTLLIQYLMWYMSV